MGEAQVPIWNVPYERNPLFTGREDVLKRLHDALRARKTAALAQPQAISGLGGIGKTQTAVEYAHRYRDDYNAILWVKAETEGSINSDFVTIANLLDLAEKQEQEQHRIVDAVKRWFHEHIGWLIIFDNADDLAMVRDFMPTGSKGHILLTTRAHATGRIAQRIEVEKMEPDEGALFLLHRATIIDPDAPFETASRTDQNTAREIVKAMDGLPLALEQAGAYIEETECGLQGYVRLYRAQGVQLLKEHGEFIPDHPEPVATTWSLSFKKVERANPAAAELLRFCAFLAPDAIPEELFTESVAELGPILEPVASDLSSLNPAIRELLKYSLVHRESETNTLSIHRLVQEVLKDQMDEEIRRLWAERTVRIVNRAFPNGEFATWQRCERCLAHAQIGATLIKRWNFTFPEASRLLNCLGFYLQERGQYTEAEPHSLLALSIREQTSGPEHSDVAESLHNLAELYGQQGKFVEAESLFQRALAVREKALGPEDREVARTLHYLAMLYGKQGKYEEAEPLFQRALAIREKTLGPERPDTAHTLHNLAVLYHIQGKYEEAEPLFQRALAIREKTLGSEHPDTARSLDTLSLIYRNQGKYEEAEQLGKQALAIREKALGPEHPDMAESLENLAGLYQAQGKYEQAESLYQRALAISEKTLVLDHPYVIERINFLASIYQLQGKYEQAKSL